MLWINNMRGGLLGTSRVVWRYSLSSSVVPCKSSAHNLRYRGNTKNRSSVFLNLTTLLPQTQRRMFSDVFQVASGIQIWRTFRSKESLYVASDGGLLGRQGTFGWVLTLSKHALFTCGEPIDGPHDTANSSCSDLCGIASWLLLMASLARNWGLHHRCFFRCITDSSSVLSKIRKIKDSTAVNHTSPTYWSWYDHCWRNLHVKSRLSGLKVINVLNVFVRHLHQEAIPLILQCFGKITWCHGTQINW